ncbi:MAG TPA: glycosyltransferase [Candidatus Sulfotelmatobacter sp.]|nr:glycosyltransferase [Candidatus Sulfotelmatobacter sp.]
MAPTVTFLVPCYKLAHFLPACVESILAQTYRDFELLILDDCSPDDTPAVARSFGDPRVRHIRNPVNLGHLANYNRGIGLARGTYIWLISADDALRTPDVLERYVRCLDQHPDASYVFCPAMLFEDGRETEVLACSTHGPEDRIFSGQAFLEKLVRFNCVAAPTGMVRRTCYETVSLFPQDLPHAGDWFLWSAFAIGHAVAYLAEPMIRYRWHAGNMTKRFKAQDRLHMIENDFAVRWRMSYRLRDTGWTALARTWREALIEDYRFRLMEGPSEAYPHGMTFEEFEPSLVRHARSPRDAAAVAGRVYLALGDRQHLRDNAAARALYGRALAHAPFSPTIWLKYLLLGLGPVGGGLWAQAAAIRRLFRPQRGGRPVAG